MARASRFPIGSGSAMQGPDYSPFLEGSRQELARQRYNAQLQQAQQRTAVEVAEAEKARQLHRELATAQLAESAKGREQQGERFEDELGLLKRGHKFREDQATEQARLRDEDLQRGREREQTAATALRDTETAWQGMKADGLTPDQARAQMIQEANQGDPDQLPTRMRAIDAWYKGATERSERQQTQAMQDATVETANLVNESARQVPMEVEGAVWYTNDEGEERQRWETRQLSPDEWGDAVRREALKQLDPEDPLYDRKRLMIDQQIQERVSSLRDRTLEQQKVQFDQGLERLKMLDRQQRTNTAAQAERRQILESFTETATVLPITIARISEEVDAGNASEADLKQIEECASLMNKIVAALSTSMARQYLPAQTGAE